MRPAGQWNGRNLQLCRRSLGGLVVDQFRPMIHHSGFPRLEGQKCYTWSPNALPHVPRTFCEVINSSAGFAFRRRRNLPLLAAFQHKQEASLCLNQEKWIAWHWGDIGGWGILYLHSIPVNSFRKLLRCFQQGSS